MTVCLPIRFDERVSLGDDERRAVESLIAECRAADGFDPCLEFDTHLNADRDMPAWRLAWAEPAVPAASSARVLVGAACAFAPSRGEGEISACVSPLFRQQGIFKALYAGLADMLYRRGAENALLVCEGDSPSGRMIARRLDAALDHGEYLMVLPPDRLVSIKAPEGLRLIPLAPGDVQEFSALSSAIFNESQDDAREFVQSVLADGDREQFFARTMEGAVGLVAVAKERDACMLHGLGVVPGFRGRGLGGDILDACLVVLRNRGVRDISLEVDVDNVPALALYRSRGFAEKNRVDYWKLPKGKD